MSATGLLSLPEEIILVILAELNPEEILRIRYVSTHSGSSASNFDTNLLILKTNKYIARATTDKSIWIRFLAAQQLELPLVHLSPAPDLTAAAELEDVVLDARRVEASWLTPRSEIPHKLPRLPGSRLLALQVHMATVVIVYSTGHAYMWSLDSRYGSLERPIAILLPPSNSIVGDVWLSCTSALDNPNKRVVLALTSELP
jgi:hypothetical protein